MVTVGAGVTVIVKFCAVPGHEPKDGVTVIVETLFVVPVFEPIKEAILPVPLAPKPVVVLLFVQVNVSPLVPVKLIAVVLCPVQIV